jgi:Family of unknown function (DUF5682)
MAIHILGIRHHGVGSAMNVVERLKQIQPDIILVEGAPEMDSLMKWVGEKSLKPPVSVLCYDEAHPQRAVFYPFSEFSPEWQAVLYANNQKIPVRNMDLPVAISWETQEQLKIKNEELKGNEENDAAENDENTEGGKNDNAEPTNADYPLSAIHYPLKKDPIGYFADIAGYTDSELWWEHNFEQKYQPQNAAEHFEAVMLMMSELRKAGIESALDKENIAREAYMGDLIRKAQREMYAEIVVVCGAWHAPALVDLDKTEKEHNKILKGLPKTKIKVGTTWVPWTNDRLSFNSGYGAGITSPGWYRHVWKYPKDRGERWLTKVAHLLRDKKMDISTAHVIETFRLSESLAGLRGLAKPSLYELNEATQSVMLMGDGIQIQLVKKELIVGTAIGKVPSELPKLPLQADFEAIVKKLKIPQTAESKEMPLDLRKDLDLQRSIFFHRLNALGIQWARPMGVRTRGTFREGWLLKWSPEMLVSLIEKGILGNTVHDATTKLLLDKAETTPSVGELAATIQQAIPAELFNAIERILFKINDLATVSADISELMIAVVPLADVQRYGNVRKTDMAEINKLVESLTVRICIGLPTACYGLDDESSQKMFDLIRKMNDAVRLIEKENLTEDWFRTLGHLTDKNGIHPVIQGCTCRLLLDAQVLDTEGVATKFSLALSTANEASFSAAWVEGFLKGSGMILLYDDVLWNLLYRWVAQLPQDIFIELLPILRRTFSKYEPAERRQLGEKAKSGLVDGTRSSSENADNPYFNTELAEKPISLVAQMLGLAV